MRQHKYAVIVGVIAAAILYGSLYPFDFQIPAGPENGLQAVLASRAVSSRGDVVANILFYLPFGFFLTQAIRRKPAGLHVVITTAAAFLLSLALETAQFYDRSRVPSLFDVQMNTTGAALGSILGVIFYGRLHLAGVEHLRRDIYPVVVLCSWAGYRLYPFIPTIDLRAYWHSLKPLIFAVEFRWVDVYRHFASGLAAALLLEVLAGPKWRRFAFPVFACLLTGGRILTGNALSWPEILGGAAAAIVWFAFLWNARPRAAIVAAAFTGNVILQALDPFEFTAFPRSFGWIPFRSAFQSPPTAAVPAMLEKSFLYSALLWLSVRAGCPFRFGLIGGAILIFVLRLTQVYIPGRSAEITDLIVFLWWGFLFRALSGTGRPALRRLEDPRTAGNDDSPADAANEAPSGGG